MISQLTGTIVSLKETSATLQVAGIGFDIAVANATTLQLKKETTLYIYMDWNQENGPSLFGFATEQEKVIFALITSCHGIGPKIALSMLQQMTPSQIIKAISSNDIKALSSINGIGAKKAEQIAVHLKHKVEKLLNSGIELADAGAASHWHDISQALNALNYSRTEVNQALQYIREAQQPNASFDQLLRQALSYLSQAR